MSPKPAIQRGLTVRAHDGSYHQVVEVVQVLGRQFVALVPLSEAAWAEIDTDPFDGVTFNPITPEEIRTLNLVLQGMEQKEEEEEGL